MSRVEMSGTFALGNLRVRRLGFGAMHLSGPGVFGPPRDRAGALAVLREAVASGVNHIDTSDYYGPYVTNQLIHDALYPYPDGLVIVTKVGARRGRDGSVLAASSPDELTLAVHDNLRHLGVGVLDVVNLRNMFGIDAMATDAIEAGLTALAGLQHQGLIRHIGLSNVTPEQVAAGRRICEIVCVQNKYNLMHREDDALVDDLARDRIAYVPFFPIDGGLRSRVPSTLAGVAQRLGATPVQVALAWLLRRAPNLLLIPGTSSLLHLRENLSAAIVRLPDEAFAMLDEGITPLRESGPWSAS
jgi:pyridoxine 4-dehydrogenase